MAERRAPEIVFWEGALALIIQLGKLCGAVAAIWFAVAWVLRPWTDPYLALPEAVAHLAEAAATSAERMVQIEARLPILPEPPFLEFRGSPRMWPEIVRPGQTVRVTHVLRRNKACETMVDRRFQDVDAAAVDPSLSFREPAVVAPLTVGFEVFTVPIRIPERITPGLYAYKPIFYCPNEAPVEPYPTFFEVIP